MEDSNHLHSNPRNHTIRDIWGHLSSGLWGALYFYKGGYKHCLPLPWKLSAFTMFPAHNLLQVISKRKRSRDLGGDYNHDRIFFTIQSFPLKFSNFSPGSKAIKIISKFLKCKYVSLERFYHFHEIFEETHNLQKFWTTAPLKSLESRS